MKSKMAKGFFSHRRVQTVLITIVALFILNFILPKFGIPMDFQGDAIKLISVSIVTALIADLIYKRK